LFGSVQAAPLYYTFDGLVTSTGLQDIGINGGDSVSYTFLINTDENEASASTTNFNGDTTTYVDDARDWFYVDLIGGDLLTPTDGGSFTDLLDIAEYNRGLDHTLYPYASILGGSDKSPSKYSPICQFFRLGRQRESCDSFRI
jgi:hypothetical protein